MVAEPALLAAAVSNREGWPQVGELGLAFVLSALIGVEREIRQKSAGLRTHTLVGVGAALFVLISKYGFADVIEPGRVVLDPSRMAAQIVTGIGFLGAGLIFVRRDSVRGLTTAAAVWVTAAIGAAAGAGLPVLAGATTGIYAVVAGALPLVARRLPRAGLSLSVIRVRYPDGRGILRDLLRLLTVLGFAVDEMATAAVGRGRLPDLTLGPGEPSVRLVEVLLRVEGRGSVHDLLIAMSEIPGVEAVIADDLNVAGE